MNGTDGSDSFASAPTEAPPTPVQGPLSCTCDQAQAQDAKHLRYSSKPRDPVHEIEASRPYIRNPIKPSAFRTRLRNPELTVEKAHLGKPSQFLSLDVKQPPFHHRED